MKWLILLLLSSCGYSSPIIISVVDTGLNLDDPRFSKHLCATGHTDLTGHGLEDTDSHGTHVVGLIQKYAGKGNYCFRIFKYYDDSDPNIINATREIEAVKLALAEGTNIINISGGGGGYVWEEAEMIRSHPEVTWVVAAGNYGVNIDLEGNQYYPASYGYPNIVVVGALTHMGQKTHPSNYGETVTAWELGENVYSTLPVGGGYKSGTSMACAVHTGKLIHRLTSTQHNAIIHRGDK